MPSYVNARFQSIQKIVNNMRENLEVSHIDDRELSAAIWDAAEDIYDNGPRRLTRDEIDRIFLARNKAKERIFPVNWLCGPMSRNVFGEGIAPE